MKGMSRGWRSGAEERCWGVFYFWISNGEKNLSKHTPPPNLHFCHMGVGQWSCGQGLKLSLCWDERGLSGKVS